MKSNSIISAFLSAFLFSVFTLAQSNDKLPVNQTVQKCSERPACVQARNKLPVFERTYEELLSNLKDTKEVASPEIIRKAMAIAGLTDEDLKELRDSGEVSCIVCKYIVRAVRAAGKIVCFTGVYTPIVTAACLYISQNPSNCEQQFDDKCEQIIDGINDDDSAETICDNIWSGMCD